MRNWSENQITLVLLRHGMTEANREHRYLGKTEEPLSREGREALLIAKQNGVYPIPEVLFVSPMLRCRQSAELLYPEKEQRQIPEWEEMDFGAFEGKNYCDLQGDARYQAWIDSNGTLPFPEGESREAFVKRCVRGFYRMLQELSGLPEKGPKTVVLVVHGGTIMALLSTFYGGDYFDYQVKNGQGYQCRLLETGERIAFSAPELLRVEKDGRNS